MKKNASLPREASADKFANQIVADSQRIIKRFSNAQARLALKGYVTESGGSGDFLVTRFGLSRWLPSIEALERYVVEVGA